MKRRGTRPRGKKHPINMVIPVNARMLEYVKRVAFQVSKEGGQWTSMAKWVRSRVLPKDWGSQLQYLRTVQPDFVQCDNREGRHDFNARLHG